MWALILIIIIAAVFLIRFSSVQELMSIANTKAQTGTPLMQVFWAIYAQPLVDNNGALNMGKVVGMIVMVAIVVGLLIYWNKRS